MAAIVKPTLLGKYFDSCICIRNFYYVLNAPRKILDLKVKTGEKKIRLPK